MYMSECEKENSEAHSLQFPFSFIFSNDSA